VRVNLDQYDQHMDWIDRTAALAILGVKPQTLYAYVSRGLVSARPDPHDHRSSQYGRDDVERAAQRRRARRSRAAVAQAAIAWGEPVMETALTTVRAGRLVYAGHDAVVLSQTATLEDVAALLWGNGPPETGQDRQARPSSRTGSVRSRIADWLAAEVGRMEDPERTTDEAWRLLAGFGAALCGPAEAGLPLHVRLARLWALPARHEEVLRQALVLIADHELNPSTFAARVAASTGASLAAAALAGFATLTGPRHGEAAAGALRLLREEALTREDRLARWRQEGSPGTGHPLYPSGDPRAVALIGSLAPDLRLAGEIAAAEAASGARANIDMALAALCVTLGLGDDAPFVLFCAGRMVGWLAHALEQSQRTDLIRPRARYVGPH
jgi:citrate synthase